MGFHSIQFPVGISYGSQGGPVWNTSIIELASGTEERVGYWSRPRYYYDVSYGVKTIDDLIAVITFFNARRGSAFGFRYKDWTDFTSASDGRSTPTATDGIIGTGDGSATQFQLAKTYSDAASSTTRLIEKPVSGTVLISVDSVATTAFSVDVETGIVTMNSAPADSSVIRAGFEFDVPVRFAASTERGMRLSYDAFDSGTLPAIELVEIVGDTPTPEDFPTGGARYVTMTGNYSIDQTARVWSFDTNGAVRTVTLPDPTYLPLGGPHWFIYNAGVSNLQVVDDSATTLATLATTQSKEILLAVDGSGDKVWRAV